jgi:formylglycine-generating enzyme required for sulfatase activity
MVLIPSGSFEMGAAENELESNQDELPQHLVTVPTFFMGRYLVTWWGDKDG